MIGFPEEKSSRGGLIAFIDLMFLLVAFLVLLLFFVQKRDQLSQAQMEAVQENLARITGEDVNVPQVLETLELVVDRFLAAREAEIERAHLAAERRKRKAARTTVKLEYAIGGLGQIIYESRTYDTERFLREVVEPMRGKHWIAFRAYATADTPFGAVVEHRQALLKGSNEFDTYWDNILRHDRKAVAPGR